MLRNCCAVDNIGCAIISVKHYPLAGRIFIRQSMVLFTVLCFTRCYTHDSSIVILLFNKPFRVLSQFTTEDDKRVLADYIDIPAVYCAGRLDFDSEGLLVLTDDGKLQQRIANPAYGKTKGYWVQVEGEPGVADLNKLRTGVTLRDGRTRPAIVEAIPPPAIWQREPPIRYRKSIPTTWLNLEISEGRNRQIRRMTAHIGFPTLRLIRYRVGNWTLGKIPVGKYSIVG